MCHFIFKLFYKLKLYHKLFCAFILPFFISISLTSCTNLDLDLFQEQEIVPEKDRQIVFNKSKPKLLQLKDHKQWTLLARVGIVSKKGSSSSQLDWVNNKTSSSSYNILLSNALTFGEIRIKSNNKVTILDYQDKTYQASNSDKLLYKLTELRLPVSQLEYWILGLPSPQYKIKNIEFNQYAMPAKLSQNNFNISYDSYSNIGNYLLPDKIIIKSPGIYIKIYVQSWNI